MPGKPQISPPIYTIGHSGHEWPTFVSLLARLGINLLFDVRAVPESPFMPYFSRFALETALPAWGVDYRFLGRELGGRRSASGIEDAVSFARGVDKVGEAWRRGRRLVLLCVEEDPWHCHRALRIAPALIAKGAEIHHIRADGSLEPQSPAWPGPGSPPRKEPT